MDWQQQLEAFRRQNPDLPDGPETVESADDRPLPSAHPRVDVGIERKGRGGKTATLITGWQLPDDELLDIARRLKQTLGTGGSARGGDILIQGDRRDDCVRLLNSYGYKSRKI
ncbi:MAG: translation initiation factor [Bacteroides sp.]|nr:translation initiation factor [Bacteroides sp.]MCM1413961.1 translation initiation factor [Bacteroides sp.]MCM1471822.1 translation initiation factor [Bacteroides sp.]